jgi:hypothetical protein
MTSDELTQEEYQRMLQQQAEMQAVQGGFLTPNEMAEYVGMLAEDTAFHIDEKGNVQGGNIPKDNLLKYWFVNNKHFRWGNYTDKQIRKLLELKILNVQLTEGMYSINHKLRLKCPEKYNQAIRTIQEIKDDVKQNVYTLEGISRAIGEQTRERMLLDTRTTAGQVNSDRSKQGMLSKLTGGLLK